DRPEFNTPVEDDLHDHLLWQLNLTPMCERDRRIAVPPIDAIEDDGYLRQARDILPAPLPPELERVAVDDIRALRHRRPHFDPRGVASRTLAECLGVQLQALGPEADCRELALRIIEGDLENLAKLGPDRLARDYGVDAESMQEAVELLRSLNPKPGSQIGSG